MVNKQIKNINVEEINYNICILNDIKADIEINLIWEKENNNKKFQVKANKSDQFHDLILKFIKNYVELKFYIITEIYF